LFQAAHNIAPTKAVEAAGTASGAMGFLQMGIGSLVSQFGAYLGGHFATPVPLNIAIAVLSIACASTMIFLVPRRNVVVSEELIEKAEEEESGCCESASANQGMMGWS
jgi:DHA1 family bicyclomycin/chloramphenicol resistance-like MFS transporter